MNAPQFIKTPTGDELVVIPKADYEALLAAAEDAEEDAADVAIYDARKAALAAGADSPLPVEVSRLILAGDSRLKALRKWRGRNQGEIAEAAGISQSYLSALEGGSRSMTDEVAGKLAAALDVPAAWIVEGGNLA